MCSWFTIENYVAYRGAILGFTGCFGALLLAYKEFRKPPEEPNGKRKRGWVAWVELGVAVVLFTQSISDIWQVNADAKERRETEEKLESTSNELAHVKSTMARPLPSALRLRDLLNSIDPQILKDLAGLIGSTNEYLSVSKPYLKSSEREALFSLEPELHGLLKVDPEWTTDGIDGNATHFTDTKFTLDVFLLKWIAAHEAPYR